VATARTGHHKLVHFPSSLRPGTFARVTVTDAAPHHLTGELREVLAEPRHRRRIPVTAA
jgi:tRNA-2-methylthio-N6-dimethylallyladenosine synthase